MADRPYEIAKLPDYVVQVLGHKPCEACGARMLRVKTNLGRVVVLDLEAATDVNGRYRSHFATCPEAKRFRKKEATDGE